MRKLTHQSTPNSGTKMCLHIRSLELLPRNTYFLSCCRPTHSVSPGKAVTTSWSTAIIRCCSFRPFPLKSISHLPLSHLSISTLPSRLCSNTIGCRSDLRIIIAFSDMVKMISGGGELWVGLLNHGQGFDKCGE